MDEYIKIGKVADLFGINPQTIRNWVEDERFQNFFSKSAQSNTDKRALFTESDIIAINTIWSLSRGRKHTLDQISIMMRGGHRETIAPERAAIVSTQTNSAMQLAGRAMSAEDRLTLVLEQLAEAQGQLALAERSHSQKVEDLMREIADLREAAGAARREIELYRSGRLKPTEGQSSE